ncbi:hypothetical protein HYFRA_00008446 [Hymenoscyphus fraxineus]|uniref:carbonic anhydrase n=1 Tax=Hymenoscyphus fraxineus TaxID=746836 RepID=A0A9N9PFC7_9HELO|nr:hypothetical protein HYFRA_00008446 [Hymenoscyphus fraxineus]
MKFTATTLVLSLTLFVGSATASCAHGTDLMKRTTFTKRDLSNGRLVERVEPAAFGYHGAKGPAVWHSLKPEWETCKTGKQQSPIDLIAGATKPVEAGAIKFNFPNVNTTEFENLGTTIEVIMQGKGATTTIDGKVFNMRQFHFHTPGEHTINGEYMPLEMHMVHQSDDGNFAVIAVGFQLNENGDLNDVLEQLAPKLYAIKEPGAITQTGELDLSSLVAELSAQPFSNYGGSLTTPPCTEGINFYIAQSPAQLDVKTFNAIKSIVHFNSRFVQNGIGAGNVLNL